MIVREEASGRGNWFQRWFGSPPPVLGELQEESLFAGLLSERPAEPISYADIPAELRRQVQEEAVTVTFRRLQGPLRALLQASAPGQEPASLHDYLQLFYRCRQALEQEIFLTPDAYPGAVRTYTLDFERDYVVHGRCQVGDPVRILVPCWRLRGEIVVRGEAEPIASSQEIGREYGREWLLSGGADLPPLSIPWADDPPADDA